MKRIPFHIEKSFSNKSVRKPESWLKFTLECIAKIEFISYTRKMKRKYECILNISFGRNSKRIRLSCRQMLCVDRIESCSSSMFCVGWQRFDEENKIVRHSRIGSRIMCIDLSQQRFVLISMNFDLSSLLFVRHSTGNKSAARHSVQW